MTRFFAAFMLTGSFVFTPALAQKVGLSITEKNCLRINDISVGLAEDVANLLRVSDDSVRLRRVWWVPEKEEGGILLPLLRDPDLPPLAPLTGYCHILLNTPKGQVRCRMTREAKIFLGKKPGEVYVHDLTPSCTQIR